MNDPEKLLPLAGGFPQPSREQWRKLVDAVLKGAPFERLVSTTYDGLSIAPLAARRAEARPIATRAGAKPWQVLARIDHPDPALAAAREEIESGAGGLSLVFAGAVGDYGHGLPTREETIARVLEGVDLRSGVTLEFDLPQSAQALIGAALENSPLSLLDTNNLRVGYDPLGAMAVAGGGAPWSDVAPLFAQTVANLMNKKFSGRLALADSRTIHNAGGSEAQELAFVLGVAVAYLRAFETAGMPLETARRLIFFKLAADADQFLSIAKFRALRKLWARVETSCRLTPEPAFVSAETAWRVMTQRDPHVNILRATIAVFAAALGGADAITVLPFTAARRVAEPFARRIARNSQLVLMDEAQLPRVADPAAGSGAMEDLTDQLCRAAWMLFREIEAAGGVAGALESGLIQSKVAAVRGSRQAAVARRKDALTGVSIFPDLHEPPLAPSPPVAEEPGQRSGRGGALRPIRLAAPFERLRDASDRLLAATNARPKVFLVSLGTAAEFTARAMFARNFFEAGGIEAVTGEALGSGQQIAAGFKTSGARLACLCASDKIYETEAAAAAEALRSAGARHIYLAGRPGDREATYRQAGVQSFIYEGCDALATLEGAYDILGIKVDEP